MWSPVSVVTAAVAVGPVMSPGLHLQVGRVDVLQRRVDELAAAAAGLEAVHEARGQQARADLVLVALGPGGLQVLDRGRDVALVALEVARGVPAARPARGAPAGGQRERGEEDGERRAAGHRTRSLASRSVPSAPDGPAPDQRPARSPAGVPRGRHAPPLEVRLSVQRRRLFTAAAAVVAREGYAGATAEGIAREAGMSKATFYEHFANKEDCVLALLDEGADRAHGPARPVRRPRPVRDLRGARAPQRPGLPETLAAHPNSTRTLLVEVAAAGPAAAARRDAVLEAFAEGLHRDNARHAPPARRADVRQPRRRLRDRRRRRARSSGGACARGRRRLRTSSPSSSGSCWARSIAPGPEAARRGRPRRPPGPVRDGRRARRPRGRVTACRRCPRLVAWRERVAREKRAAFAGEPYWGRPLPGFGDPRRARAAARPGAGRPRREPHRPDVHRRPVGRLPRRRAAPHRLRQRGRRPAAPATGCALRGAVDRRRRAVRAAAEPPDARRARRLPALDRRRARRLADVRVVVCLGAFAWDAALRLRALRGRPRRGRGRASATARPSARAVRCRCWAASTPPSRTRSPAGSRPAMLDDVLLPHVNGPPRRLASARTRDDRRPRGHPAERR